MERRGKTTSIRGVLFDRDGTLIVNVPYNSELALVRPMPGAGALLSELRRTGVKLGVISNQSGIARGLLTKEQVQAVNRKVDALLGPFDVWKFCPHGPADGCSCRKPRPGMVLAAAAELGLRPDEVAVVGDIGADIAAAHAAGSRGILVPTRETLEVEVSRAPRVAQDLWAVLPMLQAEQEGDGPDGRDRRVTP
ncbi:HAD-IIIA family hydrolase [Arthrobacter sp. NPDC080073]|uniref:D-glycero-alpha-D-manno-heptose-1,7-bisphosphate 7-phosphatase n=1 Tax=Arthrobacter sp. NPDC080073 TaxID=3155919 RepID=UPI0034160AAE